MNHLDTSCPCNPCPGSTCYCGCQASPANALPAAATDCACKGRCGCDAAEQGCLCASAPASA
jgi:hypothetical protein